MHDSTDSSTDDSTDIIEKSVIATMDGQDMDMNLAIMDGSLCERGAIVRPLDEMDDLCGLVPSLVHLSLIMDIEIGSSFLKS